MQVRRWLMGVSVGTLTLTGMMAVGPLPVGAQEASAPAAQTEPQTTGTEDHGSGPAVVGTPLLQPAIDMVRAQEIALEGQAGAVITEVEIDGDDGLLAYSIELDNGMEIDIDATSGEVLQTEQADNDNENGNGEHEDENGAEDEEENGAEQD